MSSEQKTSLPLLREGYEEMEKSGQFHVDHGVPVGLF